MVPMHNLFSTSSRRGNHMSGILVISTRTTWSGISLSPGAFHVPFVPVTQPKFKAAPTMFHTTVSAVQLSPVLMYSEAGSAARPFAARTAYAESRTAASASCRRRGAAQMTRLLAADGHCPQPAPPVSSSTADALLPSILSGCLGHRLWSLSLSAEVAELLGSASRGPLFIGTLTASVGGESTVVPRRRSGDTRWPSRCQLRLRRAPSATGSFVRQLRAPPPCHFAGEIWSAHRRPTVRNRLLEMLRRGWG